MTLTKNRKVDDIIKKGLPETITEYRSVLEEVYILGFERAIEIQSEMENNG